MTKQNSNKSILITKPYLESGGVHSFVSNIISFFTQPVFVFKRGKNPKIKFKIFILFHNFFTPFRYLFFILFYQPKYIIVNSSLSKGNLIRDGIIISISKICRKKILLIVHGFQEKALKHQFLLKQGYFRVDAIIVLSNSFAEQLKQKGYKKPIYTNWNPVSTDLIELSNRDKVAIDKKENINLLFLSRIEKAKGILTALKAFEIVKKEYTNIYLKIGGKGSALEDAKNYVRDREINNVEFLGYVKGKEKTELLKSSDIFLFPTEHKEGLPINVLEAMTVGQIVITRPIAGLVDLFNETNFGFSISSTNPKDFANAIAEILENRNKYSKIAENNATFAKKNFHPGVITEKIEKILSNL